MFQIVFDTAPASSCGPFYPVKPCAGSVTLGLGDNLQHPATELHSQWSSII